MSRRTATDDLYDPRTGGQAVRSERLRLDGTPFEPARTNYFCVYLIESGSGTFWADASQFAFGPGALLFFVPYQHIRFAPDAPVHGEVVRFHANFLCVETFHAEVGCSGVLFNDPYGVPVVVTDERAKAVVPACATVRPPLPVSVISPSGVKKLTSSRLWTRGGGPPPGGTTASHTAYLPFASSPVAGERQTSPTTATVRP